MPGSQSISKPQVFIFTPANASLTGFASNVSGATWALTANESGDGLAHQVSIRNDSANNKSGINITLVGTNADGNTQTETIAGPAGSATVESTLYYLTLTSVTPASTWGADTADIGWVDEFASPVIPVNVLAEDAMTLVSTVTGTINFALQQTFDPLDGDTVVWQPIANATALTGTGKFNTTGGATGARLVVGSYSSGAAIRLNANQTYVSNATGSALNPFAAGGTVSRSVTGTTARVALPSPRGDQVMVTSAAANSIAFIKFGDNTITAAVTDTPILPGTVQVFTIPFDVTDVAAIGTTGTTLYFTSGEGV